MDREEGFIDIMHETRLQESDLDYALKNPEGLTKEGVLYNIEQWSKKSNNPYVVMKYKVMLEKCKNLTPSGKTTDKRTILSRDKEGRITWHEAYEPLTG